MRDRDSGACLSDEMLGDYLEGSLDAPVKAASEVHLVSCGDCRNQLAFLMRLLQPEVTAGEAVTLKAIEAEWEKRKPASNSIERRKGALSRILIAFAAVAAAILIAISVNWFVQERSGDPKSAGDVVRLLFTQTRPFEARMAGQPHRPIVRLRGVAQPEASYSLLATEMSRLSANSHEMGQFYLIQKDFSRAIPYLAIAEGEVGASADVHNDLGVAYLESGDASQIDRAKQEFLHALKVDPTFADAAFNLALFYERTNATAQAEAQWKKYLELDSKSQWAGEARERLQGLSH
jgi:tetratricopeptide (TPR) repeat protein